MSLRKLQDALAALLTDAQARRTLTCDPAAFAGSFGLTPAELTQLRQIPESALASHTGTLARKRRAAAARHLPQTRSALRESFANRFAAWTEGAGRTAGAYASLRDAHDFCVFTLVDTALSAREREAVESDLLALRRVKAAPALVPRWLRRGR